MESNQINWIKVRISKKVRMNECAFFGYERISMEVLGGP
jgi:hypothetical protein